MIKAILFDVDGVLYNSMPLHVKSWQASFKRVGIKLPSKLAYDFAGMPDKQVAQQITKRLNKKFPKNITDKLAEYKIEIFNTYPKPKLIPGAKKFVADTLKNDIKICLVTGSSQTKTIQSLEKDFKLTRNSIITGKDVKHGKPHPEPYLIALKKLKVKPSEAVVIEDAPLGIKSANRAKIKCLTLTTGPYSKTELKKAGADLVVIGFGQIRQFLKIKSELV